MKGQIAVVLIIVSLAAFCYSQDISSLLMDRQYVEKEINCILEQGRCDAIGRQIKRLLPEVLNNNCRRCTPHQARNARRLVQFMQQRYPNEWRLIVQRYSDGASGYYYRNQS